MKKIFALIILLILALFLTWGFNHYRETVEKSAIEDNKEQAVYRYPDFYRGLYLTASASTNLDKLSILIEKAKGANLNTAVLDTQNYLYIPCIPSKEIVEYCIKNGFHPIARIVVFPDGLKKFPVPEKEIMEKLKIAEIACQNGFKEIQFDYIRFNDIGILHQLSLQQRYAFIEGFLEKAKNHLSSYNVIIAADIFGRVPLNTADIIGQRIEGLDKIVDIICPMAYPSHYTWDAKLMADPYNTVLITSQRAKARSKRADIVTYIQAFDMKVNLSKLTFEKYIEEQIKAVYDSGIKGYILWNSRHEYDVPLRAVRGYYEKNVPKLSVEYKKYTAPDS